MNNQIQINVDDQNTQPAGQSQAGPPQPGINYWKVSTLVLGVLLLVMLIVNVSGITSPAPEPQTPKRQTKIEGQIDCLPHKDTSGGETLECAVGLQGKDRKYYNLQGLNQQDLISGKIAPGQKVVITGILTPSQDSKYNTIGTIEVVSVEYTN